MSAAVVASFLGALADLGADRATLMRATRLPEGVLDRPQQRVDATVLRRLADCAAAALGDTPAGLRLAELYRPGFFDVYDYVLVECQSLEETFAMGRRYLALVHDGLDIVTVWTDEYLRVRYDLDGEPWTRHAIECAYATTLILLRRVLGNPTLSPAVVRFPHARPADVSEHRRLFQCRVEFSCSEHGMVWPMNLARKPLNVDDRGVGRIMRRYGDELLERLGAASFQERVRRTLASMLPNGGPYTKGVAATMGFSERSFRRRMVEEGLSFAELLDELRLELAREHLSSGTVSVTEAAQLLGYSERAAFSRAFLRWTGMSPGTYVRSTAKARRSASGTRARAAPLDPGPRSG